MTKDRVLLMIEQLLEIYRDLQYEEEEDDLLPENNLVEFA
jgi:hypothetical protein